MARAGIEGGLEAKGSPSRRRSIRVTVSRPSVAEPLQSCVELRHCVGRLFNGGKLPFLLVIDRHGRDCLAVRVGCRWIGNDVLDVHSDLFLSAGMPEYICSDNGPELNSGVYLNYLADLGTRTTYIQPGSPWENGFNEGFTGRFRNEILNEEEPVTLEDARIMTEGWALAV